MEFSHNPPLARLYIVNRHVAGILFLLPSLARFTLGRYTNRRANDKTSRPSGRGPVEFGGKRKEIAPCIAAVEPLMDFKWNEIRPLQLRPYKPKKHLTMAVEFSNASELIEMDWNYLDRIQLRRQIMSDHKNIVLASDKTAKSAVDELHVWMFKEYLPTHFPQMLQVQVDSETSSGEQGKVLNLVTSESISLQPPESPVEILRVLGGHLEDDFMFLLPSDDGDGYRLQAFVTCFPNGFNTSKKLGMKLRGIHIPVPGYKQKLEKSMERYFDRLEVVDCDNYGFSIYTIRKSPANMRVERQVVHRSPKTRAIVFSFKIYLYPLTSLKEEGVGEELTVAIDGLKFGNVPSFHFYKRAAVWGDAVKNYLRS
ncbi:hypothetical protein ACEPPN_001127 [Leptodophora sp. 'Broadleaf-Isolate-01']